MNLAIDIKYKKHKGHKTEVTESSHRTDGSCRERIVCQTCVDVEIEYEWLDK